jgi:prepilin-type N-terminal cleavage/methylation domain-containing protein
MKKKGFTLVELLVVIAIIALLMGILMPALARVRQIAFRMVCGTNLSGIGKAMLIYSNDYDDELPRAGGRNSVWSSPIPDWTALNRFNAYGLAADGSGGQGTITSCFYLLVKYAEVTPKSFICKGDSGTTEFKPADEGAGDRELIDLWDFGTDPRTHCSYSYHMPFGLYALTTSSEPGLAVAADRNPYISSPMAEAKAFPGTFNPDGGTEAVKAGNAIQHQDDGQNVLFLDNHVSFMKQPFCGVNDDNIWTYWDGGDVRIGAVPVPFSSEPQDRTDSLLVDDAEPGAGGGGGGAPKGRTCFVAETPVWLDGQSTQISDVTTSATIEEVQAHEGTFEVRDVVFNTGDSVAVVDAHKFMLEDGQWVAAQNLTSGLKLKTQDGTVTVKSVTLRSTPYTGKVYNLKVKESDQYMVGKDKVIVRDW